MTDQPQEILTLEIGQEFQIPGHPDFDEGRPIRLRRMLMADLRPAPYNPRLIKDEAFAGLKKSLAKWGLADLPCWNERTGLVIGGHQRLRVLREAGVEDTLVVVKDLDEAEEKALNITLNNERISGQFDYEGLSAIVKEIGDDIDLTEVGWPEHILQPLREAEWNPDAPDDDFGEGETRQRAVVVTFSEPQMEKVVAACAYIRESQDNVRLTVAECICIAMEQVASEPPDDDDDAE